MKLLNRKTGVKFSLQIGSNFANFGIRVISKIMTISKLDQILKLLEIMSISKLDQFPN